MVKDDTILWLGAIGVGAYFLNRSNFFNRAGEGLGDVFEGAGSAAQGVGSGVGSAAQGIGSGIGDIFQGAGSAAQGAGEGITYIFQGAGEAAQGIGEGVGDIGRAAGDTATTIGQGIAAPFGFVKTVFDVTNNKLRNGKVRPEIKDFFSNIGSKLRAPKIDLGVSGAFASAGGAIASAVRKVRKDFTSAAPVLNKKTGSAGLITLPSGSGGTRSLRGKNINSSNSNNRNAGASVPATSSSKRLRSVPIGPRQIASRIYSKARSFVRSVRRRLRR